MKIEHANFGHLNSTESVEEEEEGHKITQLEGASISSKWGLREQEEQGYRGPDRLKEAARA